MFTNKHKNSWAFFCQGTTSHLNCLEFHSINFAVEHVMTISSNKIILISKFSRKLSYHTNSRQFLQSPVLKPIKDPQNTFKMLKCEKLIKLVSFMRKFSNQSDLQNIFWNKDFLFLWYWGSWLTVLDQTFISTPWF